LSHRHTDGLLVALFMRRGCPLVVVVAFLVASCPYQHKGRFARLQSRSSSRPHGPVGMTEGIGPSIAAVPMSGSVDSPERPMLAWATRFNTKGERVLTSCPGPKSVDELPASLREETVVGFDIARYDLRGEASVMLSRAGPAAGFGWFDEGTDRERCLEDFHCKAECFSSFRVEQQWRQCVAEAEQFLAVYEQLVQEVVCPNLKAKLDDNGEAKLDDNGEATIFYYQWPPTLRLQPGPSDRYRRVHRDAEYGHQVGEINFWLPLTDYAKTGTTLWVESAPNLGDFHPLEITHGSIACFHGTLCRHSVPANTSPKTRVSMDFRIGIRPYFDPAWTLKGIDHDHSRRLCIV